MGPRSGTGEPPVRLVIGSARLVLASPDDAELVAIRDDVRGGWAGLPFHIESRTDDDIRWRRELGT